MEGYYYKGRCDLSLKIIGSILEKATESLKQKRIGGSYNFIPYSSAKLMSIFYSLSEEMTSIHTKYDLHLDNLIFHAKPYTLGVDRHNMVIIFFRTFL